MAERKRKLCRS